MESSRIVIPKTWRSELTTFLSFIGLGILGVFLTNWVPDSVVEGRLMTLFGYSIGMRLPLFWFLPAGAFSLAIIRIYDVRYVIDKKGIHCTVGIFGLSQRTTNIRYEDVRSVEIEQTILERSLGIGRLMIGTAATGSTEIMFEGITAPDEVQRMINAERDKRSRGQKRQLQEMRAQVNG